MIAPGDLILIDQAYAGFNQETSVMGGALVRFEGFRFGIVVGFIPALNNPDAIATMILIDDMLLFNWRDTLERNGCYDRPG